MAKSVYTTEYAKQIRWAINFAQMDISKLFDEALVPLADELYKFVLICDGFGGAHSEVSQPKIVPEEDLFRLVLGADPFPDTHPVSNQQKTSSPTSRNAKLRLALKDISQDFEHMLSPLMALAKGNREVTFPIGMTACYRGIFYQVSVESRTHPFLTSRPYGFSERFPDDPLRQLVSLALVLHLVRSRLIPAMIRECSRCGRVFLPTRKSRITVPLCGPTCIRARIEAKRPKHRPRANWRRFRSFLNNAKKSPRGPQATGLSRSPQPTSLSRRKLTTDGRSSVAGSNSPLGAPTQKRRYGIAFPTKRKTYFATTLTSWRIGD